MLKSIANRIPSGASISDGVKQMPDRCRAWFRRESVWGFFVGMAFILVISMMFFWPDNIDGNTLGQHDMVQGMANGEQGRAFEESTGEKALWTNSLFSGMPTFQISPEYPSNSLFSWINDAYGLWLPTPSNLLFMMMFGMLIMLSCMRLRWWYALIGAIAWGLSSYFIIIIGAGHIWKFVALSYVPPTIGALIMIYGGRRLSGAAILALFFMMELNANHPQITYYFAFLMAFLSIGYLVMAVRNKRFVSWLGGTATVAAACLLALAANLPSIYNTYEYSKETKRAASELTPLDNGDTKASAERPTGGLPKEEIGGWSNLPEESLSLLIPNIKGGASIAIKEGHNEARSLSLNEATVPEMLDSQPVLRDDLGRSMQIPLFYSLTDYFGGKGMTNGPFYVGAIVFALFILGCIVVKGPVKWALLTATVFSILLAMGNHFEAFTDFMIYNVPLYNKFRAAETALVVACLCMPVLGVMGLCKVLSAEEPLKNTRMVTGIGVGFIFPIFICLVAYVAPSLFGSAFSEEETAYIVNLQAQINDPASGITNAPEALEQLDATVKNIESVRYSMVSNDASRSLIFLVLGGGLVILAASGRMRRVFAVGGVGALVLFDLYSLDHRYIDHESFDPEITGALSIQPDEVDNFIMRDKGYYRVADLTAFGDARRSYFHNMIGGYHAAKLNRYNDLIERRMGGMIANMQPTSEADMALLNMLNAKYVIVAATDAETGQRYMDVMTNPDALGAAWLVDEVKWVDNADAEMAALASLDPGSTAVADAKFKDALGTEAVRHHASDVVELTEHTPNKLTYDVETAEGGVVVFSEVWFPWGWHATIDGEDVPIGRVNYTLRAVRVPAGKHTIEMTFDPESLHVTSGIAYGSITLIYLLCLLALFVGYFGSACNTGKGSDNEPMA